MTALKKVLILGGSMTAAWKLVNEDDYAAFGISPKVVVWHALAWRFTENNAPFRIEDNVIHFDKVINQSRYFGKIGSPMPANGASAPIALDEISGVVFTQPTTERAFFHQLFQMGYYAYSPALEETVPNKKAVSPETIYEWWRSHQYYSDRFLQILSKNHPDIPVFLPPVILPREDQPNFSKNFSHAFWLFNMALQNKLIKKYNVHSCLQPAQTFDKNSLRTKIAFAEPAPDPHHYTPEFVKTVCQSPEFQDYFAKLR